jgi:hypothetical protein
MTSLPPPPALKPIDVGPVRIDCPVVLAPMTGVTDMPFRALVRRYGSGLNVTEMIASPAMIRETRQSLQKAAWDPAEEPVSMQLAGCSPSEMADAAKLNEQRGAAIIDINMGCPVKKVVNGDAGSALMRDLPLAGGADRGDREGGLGAGHGQDAHGLGSRVPQRPRACATSPRTSARRWSPSTGARATRCTRARPTGPSSARSSTRCRSR